MGLILAVSGICMLCVVRESRLWGILGPGALHLYNRRGVCRRGGGESRTGAGQLTVLGGSCMTWHVLRQADRNDWGQLRCTIDRVVGARQREGSQSVGQSVGRRG